MLFQTNDIREASVGEDVEWYQALVRSLVEGHPWVRRAVLALDAHPLAPKPRLMLQATKGEGEILLQDVSAAAPSLGNLSWDNEWFNALKSQRTPQLRKRVLSNDLHTMETPKWQRGDSYVGEPGQVRWSPPFLECRDGRFLPAWMVTLSSAFYGLKPDLSPEFKGVVRVDIELQDVAIDQCSSGPGWFADTHRCDLNSTQCVPQESRGFVLGRYLCQCKPGFYRAGGVASGSAGADEGSRLACQPCHQGCATCEDDKPCLIQEDHVLRAAVLSCQAGCMLAVFLSMLVSYHFRRSKRIRSSGVILLETILFGSLLLYFPVFILYFKPSIFRCIVLRWVRVLGFAIVYGTITLKLHRVLKVFLSRTAQRVPYVSSGRVLKTLGLILLLVLWFLAAWTIGMLENIDKNIPLVIRTQTTHGLHFYICGHDRWDYMMVIAELLFLLWGSFLCYATRPVPSAFHEPRYMGIALHNELMISAAFHLARFIMVPSLHPDWTLLLFFAHTHSTITMTLALLFIPKLLHTGSPLREEIAAEVYEDELDMGHSRSCLNSSIASAWSEHSLDPDDIRVGGTLRTFFEELKKLYRQLEVHKTQKMAANNPHLPKKRSPRRSTLRRSSEERAGTPERRGSSARLLPDGASPRTRGGDSSRHRPATPRKSRRSEGPAREPRGGSSTPGSPGEPVLGRKMVVTAASEPSDSESLDAAPLVCKSASAQNLGGPGQPPLPHAAPLQKSHSVVSGAREVALLAASRAERHGDPHPPIPSSGQPVGQGEQARKTQSPSAADAIPPADSSPTQGGPQEHLSPLGHGKVQKHVTYTPIKSISVDSSHLPGRVRVAVRRTPPPPPVRYQSLGLCATPSRDSPEPPTDPPAQVGKPEGTAEEDPGQECPPERRGQLRAMASIPAHVCPWELVQEEILSQKQKAKEAADSGTPGDTVAAPPSLKPFSQSSLHGLELAIKAFNHARGKSILRGKREGKGSSRKRDHEQEGGSRKERSGLAGTSAMSLGGVGQGSATRSPEWSGQRPSSVPAAHSRGDSRAEGQCDRPALGTGSAEKLAEDPTALQGDVGAGGGPRPPSGVHEIPLCVGHREGAEGPCESSAVAGGGTAQICPQQEAEAPEKDAPAARVSLTTAKEGVAEGGSRSIHPPSDHAEVEQPHAKATAGRSQPPAAGVQGVAAEGTGAEACPRGASGIPAGKGALLRQEAVASQEDSEVLLGEESPGNRLKKSSSQPELLGPRESWGVRKVSPRSRSVEMAPAALGTAGRTEVCPGESWADSSMKTEICPLEESEGTPGKGGSKGEAPRPGEEPDMEKPPAPSEKVGSMEGRRAEVCPWENREVENTIRAEICPWDEEGAQLEEKRQEGVRRQLAKGIRPKSGGFLGEQEGQGSTSSEGPPPKPAPKSSELPGVTLRSRTSAQASVCPWEAAGADSDAGEVCPWERGTASSDAGKSHDGDISQEEDGASPERAAPKATPETTGKGSSQRGAPSPGEVVEQPSMGVRGKPPLLLKPSSKQVGTIDSKKANVCPWEVVDEPLPKTETCPWVEHAAPLGKEKPSQDMCGTSSGENKPGSGGLEDDKAKLAEGGGQWLEHRNTGPNTKFIKKSLEHSKTESKKSQTLVSIKEEVCPWESLGTEQSPEQPHGRSPRLPKSPSKKSQSVESLKAEVCPWEAPELEATDKAEICPWEVAAPPSGKVSSSSTSQGVLKEAAESTSAKKEAVSRDRESICPWESTDTEGTTVGSIRKSTELLKSQAFVSMESIKEEVCPWESLGTEQTPEQPHSRSPRLPKSSSKKSQSVESLKAEVCPWEAPELEATDKAEICPWEVAAPPSGKEKPRQASGALSTVSRSPSTHRSVLKEAAESTFAKKEAVSRDRESICPWESTDTEGISKSRTKSTELLKSTAKTLESMGSMKAEVCPWESTDMEQPPEKSRSGIPALPKSSSKKSQSVESLKAEVCPWEAPELEASDKAEICPWEVAAPPSGKVSRSPSTSQGVLKEKGESTSAKKEAVSRDRESICPWESTDTEGTTVGSTRKSTELLKSQAFVSMESIKEEVCPWESLGTEQTPEQPHSRSPRLPKSSSKKSQSVESLKAEVCPWEAPELEASDKAAVCPWEVAAPPSGKEKPRQEKDALSTVSRSPSTGQGLHKETGESTFAKKEAVSRDRESICPWESTDTEKPPEKSRSGIPALPKSSSKKSQSVESLKAEVCPWEAPELEASDKAAICPWEVAAPPSGTEKPRQASGALSTVSRSSSTSQGVLKEAAESTSAKKEAVSRDRESICPWESTDTEGTTVGSRTKSTELKKTTVKTSESMGSMKAEVCPWESTDTEQPPEKSRSGIPALPKSSSKKSQSVESLKAEVCPWEAPELEATDKAEICPWEVAAPPSGKVSRSSSTSQGVLKEAAESTSAKKEAVSRDRESICPWESTDTEGISKSRTKSTELLKSTAKTSESMGSMKAEVCPWESTDMEQPPEKSRSGIPALPKSSSKKSQSVESLKAEVCPWEAPELSSSDKAAICPWEAAAPLPQEGAVPGKGSSPSKPAGASKPQEKGSGERESACPWQSLGTEEPSLKTAAGKEPSRKPDRAESRTSDICPWAAAEPTGFQPGVQPRGAEGVSPSGPGEPKLVAGASDGSALLGKPTGRAEHKPLCRIVPGIQPRREAGAAPAAGSSSSPGSSTARGCPWEAEEAPAAPDKPSTDSRKSSEVCPWEEVEGVDPTPTLPGQGRAGVSPGDGDRAASGTKPDVCPWDHE
ncbi:probable G-protein coupled receptor 179 [Apus apus]|uniref:probable G-protein coupled receptor 179 n=1 Tax=Apus apus TaxID=8895 RepID=UPI0021F84B10|nr:probable G-protein coupled receptor 179 [Apus apus]